jgi:hypothetical protein
MPAVEKARSGRSRASLFAVALGAVWLACSYSPEFKSGVTKCASSGTPCPSGFTCEVALGVCVTSDAGSADAPVEHPSGGTGGSVGASGGGGGGGRGGGGTSGTGAVSGSGGSAGSGAVSGSGGSAGSGAVSGASGKGGAGGATGGSGGSGGCGDIAMSGDNCGACGHSCGGGSCKLGLCQPMALIGVTGASGLSVDATTIYFSTGNKLLSCPKGGCVLAPTQLDDMGANGYPVDTVLVTNGSLFFHSAPTQTTERDSIYMCPLTGCPTPPPIIVHGGLSGLYWGGVFNGGDVYYSIDGRQTSRLTCQPNDGMCGTGMVVIPEIPNPNLLAASSSEIYFVDTLGLQKCPYAGCPGTSSTATGATVLTSSVPTGMTYFAGTGLIYMGFGDLNHFASGVIRTCTTASCDTQTPKIFISGRDPITGLTVDANGVYWIETGALYTCPITGCVGGPKSLATGITASFALVVTDGAFVYWIDDTAGTVKRVAK